MSDFDLELVKEFLVESHENLDQLDQGLVILEEDPTNEEQIARIFRTIHTIKGTCGFFGFGLLESITHAGENLLSRLRDGELQLSADITDGLLTMVDAVRHVLTNIEITGGEGNDDYADLVSDLHQLQEQGTRSDGETLAATDAVDPAPEEAISALLDTTMSETATRSPDTRSDPELAEQRPETLPDIPSDPDGIMQQFLVQSYQNLDQLDQDLMVLGETPTDTERLSSIRQIIQTIEQTCGFFGFSQLESVTHTGVNLLNCLRDGELQLNAEISGGLLAMVEAIREIFQAIESSGAEGDGDYTELVNTLSLLQGTDKAEPTASKDTGLSQRPKSGRQLLGDLLIRISQLTPEGLQIALDEQQRGDKRKLGEILLTQGHVTLQELQEALQLQDQESAQSSVSESTIRVDVDTVLKVKSKMRRFAHG